MSEWAVVIFRSTHLALRAERVARAAGIDAQLIPAPRHLSSDCGVALRFRRDEREQIEFAFDQHDVEYEGIADLE